MSGPNPVKNSFKTTSPQSPQISRKSFLIAGIKTIVYGLEELKPDQKNVACLWLLHPRLQTQECMAPSAVEAISQWNQHLKQKKQSSDSVGLIAASFDQRNHGTRLLDPVANEAWRTGNQNHAQDMFSSYHGTAIDTSQLITYLPAYAFPHNDHVLSEHLCLGISLGGHCAWHCALEEPRIKTAVIVIGCPDYVSLMTDRARLSKLKTWTETSPPGSKFLGSKDFPAGLVEAVERYDPAGLFLGPVEQRTEESYTRKPSTDEENKAKALFAERLGGKRLLNLSGAEDKLVPYGRGEAFLNWFKKAIGSSGFASDTDVTFVDKIFPGVGHEMSPDMVEEATKFIVESLAQASQTDSLSKL